MSGACRKGTPLRPNNTTGNSRMAAMHDLPVVQESCDGSKCSRRMGRANGSRERAPDDRLRDTHRVTMHAEQADGFRKSSAHPTSYLLPNQGMGAPNQYDIQVNLRRIEPFALLGYNRIDDSKRSSRCRSLRLASRSIMQPTTMRAARSSPCFQQLTGNFRYAVDMEGYGALQFFNEEKLVIHPC